ncbi:hypothetical protein glysoja_006527 [Glycine soja]|nr:hypothetical protein glysoja_006527 [Glycine soja]
MSLPHLYLLVCQTTTHHGNLASLGVTLCISTTRLYSKVSSFLRAKFLKAGDTLARNPLEKAHPDGQPFNPSTPVKCCEEGGKRIDSLEQTPSSCISNVLSTQCDTLDSTEGIRTGSLHSLDKNDKTTASVSPWPSTTHTRRNKSVCFACDSDLSSCDSSDYGGRHMKKTDSANNESTYKPSPNPTPMKLSDEMQTPGTAYPSAKDLPNGVLTSWLKPAAVILEERNKRMQTSYNQVRKTPADRPIIGMVAAHWIEDEDSQAPPPKWWDGNGIPNSTNKYKKDQKVNWHATSFEERLEKALSEETVISQSPSFCIIELLSLA